MKGCTAGSGALCESLGRGSCSLFWGQVRCEDDEKVRGRVERSGSLELGNNVRVNRQELTAAF